MAILHSVYLTAHGLFNDANWTGETAQVGLRLCTGNDGHLPAKGSTFTVPLDNGDIVNDSGTTAGPNGVLTRTWSARMGIAGSPQNWDAGQQIDLAEDFRTFMAAVAAFQGPIWRWTHVKIAPILAGGAYGAPSAVYTLNSPVVGSAPGTSTMPPEAAVAVSLRAAVLGRRGRGRMYVPGMSPAYCNNSALVAPTAQTGLSNAAAALITNLENVGGVEDYSPLVMVQSAGQATAVRPFEVRVGSHWDSQRRRQAQAPETYTSVVL